MIYMVVNGQSVMLNLDVMSKSSNLSPLSLGKHSASLPPALILPDNSEFAGDSLDDTRD